MRRTRSRCAARATSATAGRRGCTPPPTSTRWSPQLWPATAHKVERRAGRRRGAVADLAAEYGTPAYVLDEADFRARARAFREAFAGADVYYAGKAFLCNAVARAGSPRRGSASTSAPAASSPSRCGPASTRPGSASTATTSRSPSCARALEAGVGRIIVDSFDEIDRLARWPPSAGCASRCWSG